MQGLLLINKPAGVTSFTAAHKVGRLLGEKRTGHTGTLDPMATGVLPVLCGRATALCSYLLCADKTYTATVRLGITTDTEDITGRVLSTQTVNVTPQQLDTALVHFTGKQMQIPPMYSAIKKNGVPMYALARKGQTVELAAREITVNRIELTMPLNSENCFCISVNCSKGTYIRSLCRDIGKFLGCGATLAALCRTETAGFSLSACVGLDGLNGENIVSYLQPTEDAVRHFRAVTVTEKQAVRFSNGGFLSLNRLSVSLNDGETVRVREKDTLLGLGEACTESGQLNVRCVLCDAKSTEKL